MAETPDDDTREGANEDDDILYFPHEFLREKSQPVLDKAGRPKMFFPFKELKSDEAYLQLTEKLNEGSVKKPTEALKTKLSWNSKVHTKQTNAVREMSTKTYSEIMTSALQWKIKTKRNPVIIKR